MTDALAGRGLDLPAIEARLKAATPGQWLYGSHGLHVVTNNDSFETFGVIAEMRHPKIADCTADGDFIAHAPQDIAALLEALKDVESELRAARRTLWLVLAHAPEGKVFIPDASVVSAPSTEVLETWPDIKAGGVWWRAARVLETVTE